MNANISLEQAVTEYFRHKSWATPRELVNQLYPLFQKLYPDDDTLRRLIHRILDKNDEIVQHPIRPFYVHKASLDWFNFFISQEAKSNRLDVLYNEGFIIPYKGEIQIRIKDVSDKKIIEEVLNGEIFITPNPQSKIKAEHALMIIRKI